MTQYQINYKAKKAVNHKVARWNAGSMDKMIATYREQLAIVSDAMRTGSEYHVKFSSGNIKTGAIMSVSVAPGLTCDGRCKGTCGKDCYAFGMCNRTNVRAAWCYNTAIALKDPDLYWKEVTAVSGMQRWFRFHVGGDIINADYFDRMVKCAVSNPNTTYLCFTKRFAIVNAWIARNGELPVNLKILFSGWKGMKPVNPYNLPETIGYGEEGPAESWLLCGGNCSECCCRGTGCWKAEKGETIAFKIH